MPTPEENHAAAMSRAWMPIRETLLNLRVWGGGGADASGSRAFTDLQVQKKITVGPDRIVRLLKSEQPVS